LKELGSDKADLLEDEKKKKDLTKSFLLMSPNKTHGKKKFVLFTFLHCPVVSSFEFLLSGV